MGHAQLLKHHREWRFADENEAARFDAALAKAIASCVANLERDGHSFLVSRQNGTGFILRRLESESGELLACVERLMDLPDRAGDCLGLPSVGERQVLERCEGERSDSMNKKIHSNSISFTFSSIILE